MVVKLPPKWDYVKPRGDKNGYVRGTRGFGKPDQTDRDFMKADTSLYDKMYGPNIRKVRVDGAQAVQTPAKDPGTLTNASNDGTSIGYEGQDA